MNETVNKFLWAGDKFMPEMHLKQPDLLTIHADHLLKDRKGVSSVDAFQKILDDSNRKPSKIWVDKRSEF